jgi:hypothetical protein
MAKIKSRRNSTIGRARYEMPFAGTTEHAMNQKNSRILFTGELS